VTAAAVRPRRLVFLGTPDVAVPPLQALHGAGFDIACVVTRADKRRGRGAALVPSPVKAAAVALGIPVTTDVDDARTAAADLGVVVAFGRIIRPPVLAVLPMVNLHFSLLPRWRGAAPVERAILAGDARTGVCVMAVEEGLDTGGVYARAAVGIDPEETLDALRGRLVAIGTDLLVAELERARRHGLGDPEPQHGEVTYATKIEPAELEIDWTQPAVAIHRLVRLGDAWTTFRGRRLKVWRVRMGTDGPAPDGGVTPAPGEVRGVHVGTGHGVVELIEVQPEGKGRQAARAWRNGARPEPGARLGS
jgi:methionyl-tRNA formyltransferase